jgi:hypothetical protein
VDHDSGSADHDPSRVDHDSGSADHDPSRVDHDPGSADHDSSRADHDPGSADHDPSRADHDPGSADHDSSRVDHDSSHADLYPGCTGTYSYGTGKLQNCANLSFLGPDWHTQAFLLENFALSYKLRPVLTVLS